MNNNLVTAVIGAAVAIGALMLASPPDAHADKVLVEMEVCQQEDGSDVDGFCLWIDPDTGNGYINPTPAEIIRSYAAGEYEDTGAFIGGYN